MQIRPRPRGKYYDPATDKWSYAPGEGVLKAFDPVTELAVWTFDGAITATPNYGSATTSGLITYRQLPGLGSTGTTPNLVKNGGLNQGSTSWSLSAAGSIVTDSTSITGSAIKITTASLYQEQTQIIRVEAGKTYSISGWIKSDGTNYVIFGYRWRNAAGTSISATNISTPTSSAWVESKQENVTAPGNAFDIQIYLSNDNTPSGGSMTCYGTAFRLVQAATVPAWSMDMQVTTNKGLQVYEGATNLLTNGNIETALSGTVNGFVDTFADLNAWTTIAGSPTVVSNLVSVPANAALKAGHSEWWDSSAGSQFRFKWVTGGVAILMLHYVDENNYVYLKADGANFWLGKIVAGATTEPIGGYQAAVLTNTNFYWFNPTIVGTGFAATLVNDNAGADTGATVATIASQVVADAAVTTGVIGFRATGATIVFGGAFSNVCRVVIPAPPGWAVVVSGGVPAFCVSKSTKFSGSYSLSIFNNHTSGFGEWRQAFTAATASYVMSARIKTSSIVLGGGVGARLIDTVTGPGTGAFSGTNDWTVKSVAESLTAGANNFSAQISLASGTAWFDLLWLAQQAYDTGNSDLTGQAYVATGARTKSQATLPVPPNFNIADFSAITAIRLDNPAASPSNRELLIIDTGIAGTYFQLDTNGNDFRFLKNRGGTTSVAAVTPAWSAGDTIVIGISVSASRGLSIFFSLNGGAATQVNTTTAEAKTMLGSAATVIFLGQFSDTTLQLDGTISTLRILKPGASDAYIKSVMQVM